MAAMWRGAIERRRRRARTRPALVDIADRGLARAPRAPDPEIRRAADVHLRHDRHAQGRDADAGEPGRQRAAIGVEHGLDAQRPRARRAAALSHQRLRGDDAGAARARRQPRHAAPVLGVARSGSRRANRAAPGSTWCRRSSPTCSKATRRRARALRGIRFCRSASAPLPPEQHRAFEQRFGIGIIETMGLTETRRAAFSNPLRARRAQDRLGRARLRRARRASSTRRLEPVPDGDDRRDRACAART